ncbi:phage repressor protein C with HTH and peptisase S24 domain [Pseudacidovorax sp. 1753]|uniref:LexA family transcriptional regulator n=1 Tax=Pseudacidovorax sp. 1753 TaxID=3156419 RepID=UPI003391B5C7
MQSTLAERMRIALEGPPKRTQAALAKACGIKPPSVSAWLSGETKSVEGTNLVNAAAFLGVNPKWLGEGLGPMRTGEQTSSSRLAAAPQVEVEEAPTLRSRVAVPLVGEVKGGHDGYLEETQYPVGVGEGFILYPTSDPQAYALRVRGDSMHPRYRHGEFVVVEPSHEAQPGDDVVVRCHDGRKLLKEFGWQRQDEIQLRSINDGFEPMTLSLAEVASMHLVGGRARRGALQMHT